MRLLHSTTSTSASVSNPVSTNSPAPSADSIPYLGKVPIHICKKTSVKGIYIIVAFDNPGEIRRAFQELSKIARSHDWISPASILYGILSPHQRNTYKAFLPVSRDAAATDKFPFTEIKGGHFASFKVRGDLKHTNKATHGFLHRWLPDSGYKIAGLNGFETFSENPALTASLLTGLLLSLGTKWGLFRHYWVLAKLLINSISIFLLLLHTQIIADVATAAAKSTLSPADLQGSESSL